MTVIALDTFKDLIPATLAPYQPRYIMGGHDRHGVPLRIIIYRAGAISQPIDELEGAGNDPYHWIVSFADRDFFRPVVGSRLRLQIKTREYNQLLHLSTASERDYMVEAWENYETPQARRIFIGYINPETYEQAYNRKNGLVTVEAVDGLALLRGQRFAPPPVTQGFEEGDRGPLFGVHQLKYVIAYILSLIGNRHQFAQMIPYQWREANFPASFIQTRFLDVAVNVSEYYEWNCLDVLEDILTRIKAQIFAVPFQTATSEVVYGLRLMDDALTERLDDFDVYDRFGDYHASVGRFDNPHWPIHIVTAERDLAPMGGTIETESIPQKLILTDVARTTGQLLYNGDFEHGRAAWYPDSVAVEDKWDVVDGKMILDTWEDWDGPNEPRINNEFPRRYHEGLYFFWSAVHRTRVRIEVARDKGGMPYSDDWRYRVAVGNDETEELKIWDVTSESNQYVILEHEFTVPHPRFVSLYLINSGFGSKVRVKNVEVVVVDRSDFPSEEYRDVRKEAEHILNPNSLSEVRDTVTVYPFSQIIYRNLFVRDFQYEFVARAWEIRRKRQSIWTNLSENVRARVLAYWNRARRSINNAEFIIRKHSKGTETPVRFNPLSLVQDVRIGSTFVVSSVTMGLRSLKLQMHLQEYSKTIIEPPPPPEPSSDWILFTGAWDDDGKWIDNESWNDN